MKHLRHLAQIFYFCREMGLRYVFRRVWFEIKLKSGLLKISENLWVGKHFSGISLDEWRTLNTHFFFDKHLSEITKNKSLHELSAKAENIRRNQFPFFSGVWYQMHDWHTNPQTGYKYPKNEHWTEISDFDGQAGDIKYVWEKSRFAFLFDLIRYDFHFEKDQSETVFKLIESWIDENPAGCGPNWRCSQEISIRILAWTFALRYYRFSENLSENILHKILESIGCQVDHVFRNRFFALHLVQNNHALTEALCMYLTGLLFPFFRDSIIWQNVGKQQFEEQISAQVYPDGTYMQSSMNYHRVVVQLLVWGIRLAELNGKKFLDPVYTAAKKSLYFLTCCQDSETGFLPNFGANDGALFFPLSSCHFRDFRPQLAALAHLLGEKVGYKPGLWLEELRWYFGNAKQISNTGMLNATGAFEFPKGGYYLFREPNVLTFLKCGSYAHRPHQADNMHLDIWVNGVNILFDPGTYSYLLPNGTFASTSDHNTISIGGYDQMQKSSRFMWSHWVRKSSAFTAIENGETSIMAEFEGFLTLRKGIVHRRKVTKYHDQLLWLVEDWILNAPAELFISQHWNIAQTFFDLYEIFAENENNILIPVKTRKIWYSESYGRSAEREQIVFETNGRYVRTVIKAKRKQDAHIIDPSIFSGRR